MPRVSDAKQKLMVAARDLIWESSYGATSVDDICVKADVRKGSFYHFFKSKSDLEIAALEADWQEKKAHYNDIFSPTVPPLQRLSDYFDLLLAKQTERQKACGAILGCPFCAVGTEVSLLDAGIREKVHDILGRLAKYFESAIRDAHAQGVINAPDARAKANLLIAYFQGTMAQARIENNLERIAGMKAGAFELLGVQPAQLAGV
ncbi:MAG: TetR family transcriptional regulator [Chthoniobacteraceae bacterium]|nr:TetR family transcriptional regulator [Chthoniobacteraceae bacterium]